VSDESDEKPAESDEEQETATETPTPDADTDGSGDPADERPALEADEKADFDLGDVDPSTVEGPTTDESDEDADTTDSESGEGEDADGGEDADSDDVSGEGETWGDMYVDVLGIVLVAVVEEYGDEDSDLSKQDVSELANEPPIALNEQADRLFEEMGGTKDLPPGQALAVGSATVAGSVLLRETDVASQIAGELTDSEVID